MAAVFAGATRAPFTAIVLIFEITGNYTIILPLMMAVVLSTAVYWALKKETIYTQKLVRRGVDLGQEEMADVMRTIAVKDAMTRKYITVSTSTSIDDLVRLFRDTGQHGFPVLDDEGCLAGIVTLTDVERSLGKKKEGEGQLTVGDIATRSPFVAYPDQTLDRVLAAVGDEYGRIPVVSRDDNRQLVGVLQRRDIIRAYRNRVARLRRRQE
jgi:CIC family chloride channel protein